MVDEYRPGAPSEAAPTSTPGTDRSTESAAHAAKEQARASWNETREGMRSAVQEQQRSAAEGVDEVADALRGAARQLDDRQQTASARMIDSAADGLQRLSGTLRGKDLDTVMRDIQDFARREPALFIGGAIAAGFLAVRLMGQSGERGAEPRSASSTPADYTGGRGSGPLH